MGGRLVGGQHEGLGRAGRGARQIAFSGPGIRPIGPGLGVLRIQRRGPVVVGHGGIPLGDPPKGGPAADIRRLVLGVELDCPVQVGQALAGPALQGPHKTPIAVCVGVIGGQADGLAVLGHGPAPIAFARIREAAVESGLGHIGGQADGHVEVGNGLVPLLLHQPGQRQVIIGPGVAGIELDRPVQGRDGLVRLALPEGRGPLAKGLFAGLRRRGRRRLASRLRRRRPARPRHAGQRAKQRAQHHPQTQSKIPSHRRPIFPSQLPAQRCLRASVYVLFVADSIHTLRCAMRATTRRVARH